MIGDVRDVVALIINQQLKNPKNPTITTTTQGRQAQLTKLLSYARWTVKNNNGNCKWIITNPSRSWSGFWGFEYRDWCSRLRLSLNSNRFGARRNWQIGLTTGPETRLQLQPFNTLSEQPLTLLGSRTFTAQSPTEWVRLTKAQCDVFTEPFGWLHFWLSGPRLPFPDK